MPKQEIESAIVGRDEFTVGQAVCIVGRGTSNLVHRHGTVKRFTATMMIVEYPVRRGGDRILLQRRYRTGLGGGRETGGDPYDGSYVAARCQRAG